MQKKPSISSRAFRATLYESNRFNQHFPGCGLPGRKQISDNKKGGHLPPFLRTLSKCLLQQDTAILNEEWSKYQAKNRRKLDQDIQ